ncbi:MAG: UDP-N-acetylmuramoyl-tripeptide--D-alanyl-D-alanine ligase [Gammaproteobacteria bacterium]|nr:UDP-N-acetylmuramoyl-tripeptide--D-alanyl-D-alanine ligase [Gammaproteobacteria bacterium]
MLNFSTQRIRKLLGATQCGDDATIHGISIDTRTIQKNNLFVAINGENFDGQQFIPAAHQQGAAAVLSSQPSTENITQLVVDDPCQALGKITQHWRQQFDLPIVGITGSCGKTTTKQMLGTILQQAGDTLITPGNFNNFYGVPLTLAQLNGQHHYAVIEMGADRPGEIKYLSQLVQAEIAIVTNIAPVHLDVGNGNGFGTIDSILQEKTQLFHSLPTDGVAIINADDPLISSWAKQSLQHRSISFGIEHQADITAHNLKANTNMQYSFDLLTPKGNIAITLASLGYHNVLNAMAASAAAIALDLSLEHIKQGLAEVQPITRRLMQYRGINNALIIDDSYNANSKSVNAVIDMLAHYSGQRIMVLGDMLEIGEQSMAQHRNVGETAKRLGIERLLTYGQDSQHASQLFGKGGQHFTEKNLLIDALKAYLAPHTTVMIKGSHGMHMDKIVQALIKK